MIQTITRFERTLLNTTLEQLDASILQSFSYSHSWAYDLIIDMPHIHCTSTSDWFPHSDQPSSPLHESAIQAKSFKPSGDDDKKMQHMSSN